MTHMIKSPFKRIFAVMLLLTSIFVLVGCIEEEPVKEDVTISFVTNDTVTKASITIKSGSRLSEADLSIHERNNYDFNGWFYDAGLNQAFDPLAMIGNSITLYAKWTEHEIIPEEPVYRYELIFNGGNYQYENREQMVADWLDDYNTFAEATYTLETLPMDKDSLLDIAEFMFEAAYRDKWLWMARYLRLEGSDTNKTSVNALIAQSSLERFYNHHEKNKFAVSYEIRAFIKASQFTDDPNLVSSDYSNEALKNGFWAFLIGAQQTVFEDAQGEILLPTELYKEGYVFYGWYETENFYGEPVTTVSGSTALYARFDGENPIDSIVIENIVEYMEKGTELTLDITILPVEATFKDLRFEIREFAVAKISDAGVITALNEGQFVLSIMAENGRLLKVVEIEVYPKDDIKLSFNEGYNGYMMIDEQFQMNVEGVGRQAASSHYTFSVEDPTVVNMSEPGVFNALKLGSTQIHIHNLDTVVMSYTVMVQETYTESRIDQLLTILRNGHNAVATPVTFVTRYETTNEYRDPRHESVNAFLFDDLEIDKDSYPMPPGLKNSGARTSTEFILLHDTANLNIGLMGHGAFFQSPGNAVSIHYITGDYGVLQSLAEDRVGWHAGDGTGTAFQWYKTGVVATDSNKPFIDIAADGYFTINGEKTIVMSPKGLNGEVLTRDYFTYLGPTWDIFDGEYVIGRTYIATSQQKRGVIASYGGNRNSVGIEMSINVDGDIVDTVQRTAKLVAHLLEQYDLPNHRVITHNTTDGKGDPYTLHNTEYNGTWYFDRFMEYLEIEREILVHFSDAVISISSDSDLVSSTGRITRFPDVTTEVVYTITVEIDGVSKSIDLVTVVPGMSTWDQLHGFFTPTRAWAKADYRNDN